VFAVDIARRARWLVRAGSTRLNRCAIGISFIAAALSSVSQATDDAAPNQADRSFQLQYKLKPGEQIRYEVVHLVTVKTEVQGSGQNNQSRSKSMKLWDVHDFDTQGSIVFTHSIEYVDMWSETSGRQPVSYDSRKDNDPPVQYEAIGDVVGKPLSLVTMTSSGEVVSREDEIKQIDLGMGGITVPLPSNPVKIGDTWSSPSTVAVRLEDMTIKQIKIRQLYRLEKVAAGVATISVNSQVLTPVDDARVQSQLIQRLSKGEIKFDMDTGRVLSKQLDWDETVVSFSGPASRMEYLGRMTETLVEPRVARARR